MINVRKFNNGLFSSRQSWYVDYQFSSWYSNYAKITLMKYADAPTHSHAYRIALCVCVKPKRLTPSDLNRQKCVDIMFENNLDSWLCSIHSRVNLNTYHTNNCYKQLNRQKWISLQKTFPKKHVEENRRDENRMEM